jgi:hypothetical protein
MRLLVTTSLLVALPTLLLNSADGARFSDISASLRSSISSTSRRPGLFGLAKTVSRWPRGGAEEEATEAVEEALYLPGLLDASISRSDQVRFLKSNDYCHNIYISV